MIAFGFCVDRFHLAHKLPHWLPMRGTDRRAFHGFLDVRARSQGCSLSPSDSPFRPTCASFSPSTSRRAPSASFPGIGGMIEILAVLPIILTIASLPISLSGVGVREGLFQNVLASLFGTPESLAVMISITGFLIVVFWGLVGGCVYLVYRPTGGLAPRRGAGGGSRGRGIHRGQGVSSLRGTTSRDCELRHDGGRKGLHAQFHADWIHEQSRQAAAPRNSLPWRRRARWREDGLHRSDEHGNHSGRSSRAASACTGLSPEPLRVVVSNSGSIESFLEGISKHPAPRSSSFPLAKCLKTCVPRSRSIADLWIFNASKVDLAMRCCASSAATTWCGQLFAKAGPDFFGRFLEIGAVDELHLTWAPLIFGGAGAPTLTGIPDRFLPKTIRCHLKKMQVEGNECFLTYTL